MITHRPFDLRSYLFVAEDKRTASYLDSIIQDPLVGVVSFSNVDAMRGLRSTDVVYVDDRLRSPGFESMWPETLTYAVASVVRVRGQVIPFNLEDPLVVDRINDEYRRLWPSSDLWPSADDGG